MIADADIEAARQRFDVIASEVPLRRRGHELVGLCPFHNEKSPSFAIVPEKGFFHCHGCGAHGTAIDFIMRTRRLDFVEAVRVLLNLPSLPPQRDRIVKAERRVENDARDIATARDIWDGATGTGGRVRLYLQSRYLPSDIPPAIREHPALACSLAAEGRVSGVPPWRSWEDGAGGWWLGAKLPALVAAFQNSRDAVTAVQRIWLEDKFWVDETGGDPKGSRLRGAPKKTRGVIGDGAVRLAPAGPMLGIAEGVETALAAARLHRMPVWALGGLARLGYPAHRDPKTGRPVEARPPTVWIPPEVRHLVIFGDGNKIGRLVADFAAQWWRREWRGSGRHAEAICPEIGYGDFQDKLRTAVLAGAIR